MQGMSHYLEHMLFMGSEKFPDENDYDSYLQHHGGSSNAYTEMVREPAACMAHIREVVVTDLCALLLCWSSVWDPCHHSDQGPACICLSGWRACACPAGGLCRVGMWPACSPAGMPS